MKKLLLCLSIVCSALLLQAQEKTVSGKVTSSSGEELPGVNVLLKGTTTGVITDLSGNYTISVPAEGAVLVFSFVGMNTEEVMIGSRTVVDFQMSEDVQQLSEVVVIGYGSASKKDATGAVDVVTTASFNKGVTTSPDQLLQGRSAGVQVTTSSGEPGAGSSIRIRGSSSVRSGNEPLYVIDGVPFNNSANSPGASTMLGNSSAKNPLNFLNSNDIESISILKDASSTAIYGSRAANGVIIITTKSGKKGAGKLNYSHSSMFSNMVRPLDVLSAAEFREANEANASDDNSDVNALDAMSRTAYTQEHNLSYSGGSNTGNYRVSLGMLNQEGVIKNTGMDKYTINTNVSQRF